MPIPPTFNLTLNYWVDTNTPGGGPPDGGPIACQLYFNSRGLLDITPASRDDWVPPLWMRTPKAALPDNMNIFECPVGSGNYYLVRWGHPAHLGFPNEYQQWLCEMCDDAGAPIYTRT